VNITGWLNARKNPGHTLRISLEGRSKGMGFRTSVEP
jgi:hypothetical protein